MERPFEFMEQSGSLTPLPSNLPLGSRRGAERLPMNASSTQALQLICPLTEDGSSISAFFGMFWDRNPNASVACSVVTESPTSQGGSVIQFFGTSSTGIGTNSPSVTLGNVSGAQGLGNYSYAICVIPPMTASGASGVLMMTVTEGSPF